MARRDIPVTRFVALVLLIVALVLFAALGTLDHLSVRARRYATLRTHARLMADQLAASLALPVWNFDQPQLDKIADSVMHFREAAAVIVRLNDVSSGSGFRTMGRSRDQAEVVIPVTQDPSGLADALLEERTIFAAGEPMGLVKVYYTPHYLQAELRNHLIRQLITFIGFGIILTAVLYLLLWRTVMRPLQLIEQYAGAVSSGGSAGLPRGHFRGELERLRASLEKMVELLAARYASLLASERRIAGQLRFEELVAGISAQLVAAEPDNLQRILTRALEDIGLMLDADRVVLGQTDEQTGEMIARAHFCRTAPPFPERLVISERYPWLWQTLRGGQVSYIDKVANLGAAQAVDQRHFEEVGIQSQVTVPVMMDGRLQYLLAVASVARTAQWSEEVVARIRVLADVLATTALRCAAEEIVRSSERQFRTFIEQAPVPILLVPSPDRAPVYFNPAFTRVFGYSREDMPQPEDCWRLIFPDAKYRAAVHNVWKAIVTQAQETGFQDSAEAEMRTKSGESRFVQVRIAMVENFRMTFINDLTARRQAETALRLTQFAVDRNPVMIFRIDMEGRFVYANDAARTEFGYAPAEMLSLHIWDIARTVTQEQWPVRAAAVSEQRSTSLESVFGRRNGATFPVEVRTLYVEFSGERHFFVFAYDITERKAAREAEHAYTRRMHKIATELTRAEERQRRELATILHDEVGQNLFAATTQLLTIRGRSEGVRLELDKALSLLDSVTRDTRELTFELCPPVLYQLGLTAAIQRLADQFTARHGIPCTLTGDSAGPEDLNVRGLAYQAVRELLNNTAKHARAKNVAIEAAEIDGHVRIQVCDDGIGFDATNLQPGTGGFGLFHLRERVELLGGGLAIDAAQPSGCRVQLTLPLNVLQPVE